MYKRPDNKPTVLNDGQPMGKVIKKKKDIKYIKEVTRIRKK